MIVGRIRDSITFAAGHKRELGRYEVPREVSLPGFGIWMINEDCHIAGIRHVVTERLKRAVMYSMYIGPSCFKWTMLSLSGQGALLFPQVLIDHLSRSVVNVCVISKDFLFVSLTHVYINRLYAELNQTINYWLPIILMI